MRLSTNDRPHGSAICRFLQQNNLTDESCKFQTTAPSYRGPRTVMDWIPFRHAKNVVVKHQTKQRMVLNQQYHSREGETVSTRYRFSRSNTRDNDMRDIVIHPPLHKATPH